jgi:hypothetical protein
MNHFDVFGSFAKLEAIESLCRSLRLLNALGLFRGFVEVTAVRLRIVRNRGDPCGIWAGVVLAA